MSPCGEQQGSREGPGDRRRSREAGFTEEAWEFQCPGSPVQHLPGTSSAPATPPHWNRGKVTGRPSAGLLQASGTQHWHEAERQQVLPGSRPPTCGPGSPLSSLWQLPYGLWSAHAPPVVGFGCGAQDNVIPTCIFPKERLDVEINPGLTRGINCCA